MHDLLLRNHFWTHGLLLLLLILLLIRVRRTLAARAAHVLLTRSVITIWAHAIRALATRPRFAFRSLCLAGQGFSRGTLVEVCETEKERTYVGDGESAL